jgi:fibro-slime domain-containing protein
MRVFAVVSVLSLIAAFACGTEDGASPFPVGSGASSGASGTSGTPVIPIFGDSGASADASATQSDANCTPNLEGILHDFRGKNESGGHQDFESVTGGSRTGLDPGMVSETLGTDRKPVFAGPTKSQSNKTNFDQWYRDTPGVNMTENITLPFVIDPATGRTTYESSAFFPLDGKGFGNTPGQGHNYSFTYELHTQFVYQGGEVFQFRGDDDVWVFVNDKLVVDLGGVHQAESATVSMDAVAAQIGIVPGQAYPLDFFFAERHTVQSNFRFETTLKFVNCSPILPPGDPPR